MSGISIAINSHGDDGGFTQSLWIVKADVAEQIRELLGEPVAEVMVTGPTVAAMGHAGEAHGGVVVCLGDAP